MKDTVSTAFSFALLLIVCDDDEVSVGATKKKALEFRFYTLFVDTSFIVMSDLRVKENKSTIAVLKSESIIDDEVLAVHIETVVIKNNFTAAVQAADIEAFMIEIVIREEVKAVDIEASSIKDEIEVEVWAITEEAEQTDIIWTVLMNRDKKKRCR